jgi:antirestriction protein ArdC
MKTNAKQNDIYVQITGAIIKELENGTVPWQKPWQNGEFRGCISHTSGKPYSMLNQWLLGNRAGEWLTYKQIQKEGGKVKAGEKSSFVVFWDFVNVTKTETEEDENGNKIEVTKIVKRYPMLKGYNVFHVEQCEDIKPKFNNKALTYEHTPVEMAEKVVAEYVERENLHLEIKDTNRACYSPLFDCVEIPMRKQFKEGAEYYSTLFHELTHSTGHAKRLNRPEVVNVNFFGSEDYSKEELVAEMGAAFLCQAMQIECEKAFKNSASYIAGWLRALKNDKKLVVMAAAKAEKAAEYIMHGTK